MGFNSSKFSELLRVNVGDTINSVIQAINIEQAQDKATYLCKMVSSSGVATQLQVDSIPELLQAVITLEAYHVNHCSDYPDTESTKFWNVGIGTTPIPYNVSSVPWTLEKNFKECGQDIKVINASSNAGEVDIFYRHAP